MPNLTALSRLELEHNLTQLAAHIIAATYQFLSIISARLPAEQGEALVKSIESAQEVLLTERNNVPAGTPTEDSKDNEHDSKLAG